MRICIRVRIYRYCFRINKLGYAAHPTTLKVGCTIVQCTLYLQYRYLTRLWRVCQARTSKFPKPLNALQTWIFLKAGTDFLKFRKKCRYSFKILKFRLIFQIWPKYSDTKKKIRICNTIMQCIIILTVSQWKNLNIECLEIQSFVASFWIKKQIPGI